MQNLPKRKDIRLEEFDYSSAGAYFITICTAERRPVLWCRGDLRSPAEIPLSHAGSIVNRELQKLNTVYPNVRVDKYCIMPDHIHMILRIEEPVYGRPQVAPTISRVIQQFKGSISKQLEQSIWQKSFYEHGIQNRQDYQEIWEYIENNPRKYLLKQAP